MRGGGNAAGGSLAVFIFGAILLISFWIWRSLKAHARNLERNTVVYEFDEWGRITKATHPDGYLMCDWDDYPENPEIGTRVFERDTQKLFVYKDHVDRWVEETDAPDTRRDSAGPTE